MPRGSTFLPPTPYSTFEKGIAHPFFGVLTMCQQNTGATDKELLEEERKQIDKKAIVLCAKTE